MALVATADLGVAFLATGLEAAFAAFEADLGLVADFEVDLALLEGLVASALLAVLALRGLEMWAGASAAIARTDLRMSSLMVTSWGGAGDGEGREFSECGGIERSLVMYPPLIYPRNATRSRVRVHASVD